MILTLIPSDSFDTALARAGFDVLALAGFFFFPSALLPSRTFYFMNNVATARGGSSLGSGDHGGHTLRVGRST